MKKTTINKKAAIELSIGTVVIIVLAMSMLILGLVLVRNIFTGAIDSVNDLDGKVKGEISNLFTEEGSKIAIRLGSDKTANIKAGKGPQGIGFGAKSPDGDALKGRGDLKYRLELESKTDSPGNCVDKLGMAKV